MSKKLEKFNVLSVDLGGSNLIEASAGTGKTYSIAILTLRLILKGISVDQILMVTFTKAAVAELEGRIRDFVRLAWAFSTGHPIEDKNIIKVLNEAGKTTEPEVITDRLHKAMLLMDDASIRTIHSFCQQVLSEYAFETGQLFQAELVSNESEFIEDAVNKFWRKFITGLDPDLYGMLVSNHFTRTSLVEAVKFHNGGKRFAGADAGVNDLRAENFIVRLNERFSDCTARQYDLDMAFKEKLRADIPTLVTRMQGAKKVPPVAKDLLIRGDVNEVFEWLSEHKSAQYFIAIAQDYPDKIKDLEQGKRKIRLSVVGTAFEFALRQILDTLASNRERKNQITFDELITKLHAVVVGHKSEEIKEALRNKYKVVFVDEFQDTDRQQYEIFKGLFLKEGITVFFIGDPKQSIYAFRQADVFTYFRAGHEVDHRYSMNVNFRSSSEMVKALNYFFLPHEKFDTFGFGENENQIVYQAVEPGPDAKEGALMCEGETAQPMMVFNAKNKEDLSTITANTIANLLSDSRWAIKVKGTSRAMVPGDFGVLVRTKKEAAAVRKALARFRIPAVTIDDTKILETEEALEVLYVLEAALNPTLPGLHKALLTSMTRMTIEEVMALEEDWLLKRFRDYQKKWLEKGVFVMLTSFLSDFRIHAVLMKSGDPMSARTQSNIGQITELLHKMEKQQNYAPSELVVWLQKGINDGQLEGDEYELRIESDEASVNVLTIHRSKGLEYNIVFAPYLDFIPRKKRELTTYRDPNRGIYVFQNSVQLDDQSNAWYLKEQEQENRRLIYVALTRARFGCVLIQSNGSYFKNSTLKYFTQVLKEQVKGGAGSGILFDPAFPEMNSTYRYEASVKEQLIETTRPKHVAWQHRNWKKLSYSYLSEKQNRTAVRLTREQESDYDRFIFRELPKGAVTGNLLHYIFEHIDFSNASGWDRVVKMAMHRLSYSREDIRSGVLEMLRVITEVTIPEVNFKLSSVGLGLRLNELEFDFNVAPFDAQDLTRLESVSFPIQAINERNLEGVMNGKIDLFFQAGGKYYVLDWKSNFLGDSVEDYEQQGLLDAMDAGNYHLQYHLYSLAVHKYLQSRVQGFDYERDFGGVIYVFLRGVRVGRKSGLFFTRPDLKVILELDGLFRSQASGQVIA